MPEWPSDLAWMINTLGTIPNDVTSTILKGRVETDRRSWERLEAMARSGAAFTYRDVIVRFSSPPVATEHAPHLSDMMPSRFRVSLDLRITKER